MNSKIVLAVSILISLVVGFAFGYVLRPLPEPERIVEVKEVEVEKVVEIPFWKQEQTRRIELENRMPKLLDSNGDDVSARIVRTNPLEQQLGDSVISYSRQQAMLEGLDCAIFSTSDHNDVRLPYRVDRCTIVEVNGDDADKRMVFAVIIGVGNYHEGGPYLQSHVYLFGKTQTVVYSGLSHNLIDQITNLAYQTWDTGNDEVSHIGTEGFFKRNEFVQTVLNGELAVPVNPLILDEEERIIQQLKDQFTE